MKAVEGTGGSCVANGKEPPKGSVRYPKGKVPEYVDDKWDKHWRKVVFDKNGHIVKTKAVDKNGHIVKKKRASGRWKTQDCRTWPTATDWTSRAEAY